jgi:hypothetical protein
MRRRRLWGRTRRRRSGRVAPTLRRLRTWCMARESPRGCDLRGASCRARQRGDGGLEPPRVRWGRDAARARWRRWRRWCRRRRGAQLRSVRRRLPMLYGQRRLPHASHRPSGSRANFPTPRGRPRGADKGDERFADPAMAPLHSSAVACPSGQRSTPRKRVRGNPPRVQIPPPPPSGLPPRTTQRRLAHARRRSCVLAQRENSRRAVRVLSQPGPLLERPGSLLERPGSLLERPGSLPEQPGPLPEQPGSLPEQPGPLPELTGPLPDRGHGRVTGSVTVNPATERSF